MHHLGRMVCREHVLRRVPRERGGKEKSVPIEAVHMARVA